MPYNANGKVTINQLSPGLRNLILNSAGGIRVQRQNYRISTSGVTSIRLIFDDINTDSDSILVFKNSTFLEEGTDYTITSDNKYIVAGTGIEWSGTQDAPIVFNIILIRNTMPGDTFVSGYYIADGTVTRRKLSSEILDAIYNIGHDRTYIKKGVSLNRTLESGKWTPVGGSFQYTVDIPPEYVEYVTETSEQEIRPAPAITSNQFNAYQQAKILEGGQTSGKIILRCLGTQPTVDIPVRILLRGETMISG